MIPAILILILIFLAGVAVEKVLQRKISLTGTVLNGFLVTLAAFHLLASLFRWTGLSFTAFFFTYAGFLAAAAVWGIYLLIKERSGRQYCANLLDAAGSGFKNAPVLLVLLAAAGLFLYLSFAFSYHSFDDDLYLPKAMEMLNHNTLHITERIGWSGLETVSYLDPADYTTLEAWRAFWSRLFGIHVTLLSKTCLPAVFITVSFCALYQAYDAVSGGKNPLGAMIFLAVYLLLVVFDDHTPNWAPMWILRYPAQGKSVLNGLIFPALAAACARIINCDQEKIPWPLWFLLSVTMVCGIAVTVIGIYWPVLCAVSMGLPFLILVRRKDFFRLLPRLILVCLPVILFGVLALGHVSHMSAHYNAVELPDWTQALEEGLNVSRLIPFTVCLIYLLFRPGKTARLLFGGSTVFLALTLLNPLFLSPVARYISSATVYFRLFWMLPVYLVIPYAAADLLTRIPQKILNGTVLAGFLLTGALYAGCKVLSPDVPVSSRSRVFALILDTKDQLLEKREPRENGYCLEQSTVALCDAMLEGRKEQVRVFWMSKKVCPFRQYSIDIQLLGGVWPGQQKFYDQPVEPGSPIPYDLYQEFSAENIRDFEDPERARQQLKAMKVDYIFVDVDSGFALREQVPEGFEPFCEELLAENGIKYRGYRVQ